MWLTDAGLAANRTEPIGCLPPPSSQANGVTAMRLTPSGPTNSPARKLLGPGSPLDSDQLLDPALNEHFLFHGTSAEVASLIVQHGFDERVTK